MVTTLSTEQVDRLIDEHFRYECEDDVEGVLTTLAEDAAHDVVGSPLGELHGREEARRFYEQLYADLDGHAVTSLHRYYGEGFVVDESLWEGVAIGAPLGIQGNGKPLSFRILHVFELTPAGAIARENVWMDYPAIVQQLAPSESGEAQLAEQSRSVVLRMYEEFDRGELDQFDAIAPTFSARVVGRSEPLDLNEFTQFARAFLTAFPDGHHVFEHVVAEGDNVMTLGTYEGTHRGELQGIAPTGRRVKFPVMHLDRVVDGKIVEHRGLGDLTILMEQLGVKRDGQTSA
jgi:predicted ester cyclase